MSAQMHDLAELGLRLRARREAAGLSQDELAARAGIGSATVGRIENGQHRARKATITVLAHALSIEPEELLEVKAS